MPAQATESQGGSGTHSSAVAAALKGGTYSAKTALFERRETCGMMQTSGNGPCPRMYRMGYEWESDGEGEDNAAYIILDVSAKIAFKRGQEQNMFDVPVALNQVDTKWDLKTAGKYTVSSVIYRVGGNHFATTLLIGGVW